MARGTREKLSFAAAAAALAFGALELGLRLTVPLETLRFSWEQESALLGLDDQGALNVRPHHTQTYHDGPYAWTVRTATMGLREDADPSPEIPAGTTRLLALGDSWMFGWSADQGLTLPDQLERLLPARLGVERVEVINGGIFGSCAFDMLRRWRQVSAQLELDGVILGRPHNLTRQAAVAERRTRWYQDVRGAPFVDVRTYLALRRLLAPLTRPQYPAATGANADAATLADLTTLITDARAQGLDVWFVGFPTAMDEALNGRQGALRSFEGTLSPLGVPSAGHLLNERSCWGHEDLNHPSPAGYLALAEVTAELIAGAILADEPAARRMRAAPSCDTVNAPGPGKP
ncbi:hypothetical protein L6R49_15755 [Myxococcota bacterium]|nr:hypothetical protein [Myxococcota bacterium]